MSLLALQRDFRDWLTAESAEAAARLEGPGGRGLPVYLNTYRSQLLACLGETFAMARAWIGDAVFEAAAATHVDRVPPSSWTLDAYARDFPETLDMLHALMIPKSASWRVSNGPCPTSSSALMPGRSPSTIWAGSTGTGPCCGWCRPSPCCPS